MSNADSPSDRQTEAHLHSLIDQIVSSYDADDRTEHLGSIFLPNRQRTVEALELLRRLIFPGFFDQHRLTRQNIRYHISELLAAVHDLLFDQINQALRYELNRTQGSRKGDHCDRCQQQAQTITAAFLNQIPAIRRRLALDVQATFQGDPAAASTDETIFCYPGVDAIFTHRIAHALFQLGVPLLPRILSEYAHNETGIDIHPGATIGDSFCIDHGTGVVIGETTVIGHNVIIYQGVTLGALSTKGGQRWRGMKRHPTIEDDVTIYGGAIILGGQTVVGKGSVIGGSVFITSSIPPDHIVSTRKGELDIKPRPKAKKKKAKNAAPEPPDFQI